MLVFVPIVLLIIALLAQKFFADNYSRGLKQTVLDANAIKDELEKVLENSLHVSELIIDRLDTGAGSMNNALPREELCIERESPNEKGASLPAEENKSAHERIRLYELAQELEIQSKELIQLLNDMGYSYSHHMNLISCETAEIIKDKLIIQKDKSDPPPAFIPEKILLSEEVIIREEPSALGFSYDEIRTAHPYLAVRSLHEKGYNIKEIAQILERGQGEVGLILNLARKKAII